MSLQSNIDGIIQELANKATKRITRKTISQIQKLKPAVLDDNHTSWDDICVQMQSSKTHIMWAYDNLTEAVVTEHLENLNLHEKLAIWIQTKAGQEWILNEEEIWFDVIPYYQQDVIDYIVYLHVYQVAGNWSNKRIKEYLGQ